MSDNQPEPVVTPCDEDAAEAFLAHYYKTAGAFDIALILAFAAHRTAAVARREAEIVAWIRGLAEAYKQLDGAPCSFTTNILTALRIADDIERGDHVKIQNGGGA